MRIQNLRIPLYACLALALLQVSSVSVGSSPRQETQANSLDLRFAAATLGRVIPLAPAGPKPPSVDGDLSDWGTLDPRSGCIVQGIDDVSGFASDKSKDAAVFNLRYDNQALYITVRVLDASVKTQDPPYLGDCVQLFLDVRPTSGSGPKLGNRDYSDGVYQLMITAPKPGDRTVRWIAGNQKVAPLGPFDIAGRALTNGYALELRIPFSSLGGMTPERLQNPIGFDLYVDDTVAVPAAAHRAAKDYHIDPSILTLLDQAAGAKQPK